LVVEHFAEESKQVVAPRLGGQPRPHRGDRTQGPSSRLMLQGHHAWRRPAHRALVARLEWVSVPAHRRYFERATDW